MSSFDIAIVGAGAAGLTAAIFAGEAAAGTGTSIVLIDGAKKPGAKILVSGGGRCNVTNEKVMPEDFWGGPRTIIRKVLSAFDERRTLEWMRDLGVPLKLEPTGKYFPVSDQARSVLDALLRRVRDLGVAMMTGTRVTAIRNSDIGLELAIEGQSPILAHRLIMATGGKSLPKSGSDGWGLEAVRALGHTIHPTTPALSPLVLNKGRAIGGRFAEFSGITMEATLALYREDGKKITSLEGSLLFTHFGISGPVALNMSRHWLRVGIADKDSVPVLTLGLSSLPSPEAADRWLLDQTSQNPRRTVAAALAELIPDRIAKAMAEGTDTLAHLTREQRLDLARNLTRMPLDVAGDRGYSFAEVTAGGVDLREIDSRTMQSRIVPNLYLCGEMLDVDGRIGGFNFQWAWASGYLAGRGAAASLLST